LLVRNTGRLYFAIHPFDIDNYLFCRNSKSGTTENWLPGEVHHLSCGWNKNPENFMLYADAVETRLHTARDKKFKLKKITRVDVMNQAGEIENLNIWLSGDGIGPRKVEKSLPMKVIPPKKIYLSSTVILPISVRFDIAD
jgi:hypothetical protein